MMTVLSRAAFLLTTVLLALGCDRDVSVAQQPADDTRLPASDSTHPSSTSPSENAPATSELDAAAPWKTPADLALFFARQIVQDNDRAAALIRIAAAQVEAGDRQEAQPILEQALETLRLDDNEVFRSRERLNLLFEIASVQAAAGFRQQTLTTLDQALKQAPHVDDEYSKYRIESSFAIPVLLELGDTKQALAAVVSVESEAPGVRVEALLSIASHLIETKDSRQALEILEQAAAESRNIRNEVSQAASLSRIAVLQFKAGDTDRSSTTFDRALHLCEPRDEDPNSRVHALGNVAPALVEVGHVDRARDMARQGDTVYARSSIRRHIVEALAASGDIQTGHDIALKIEDPSVREAALQAIASALARTGDFSHAMEVAQMISNPHIGTDALRDITLALVKAGEFEQALTMARQIPYEEFRGRRFIRTAALARVASGQAIAGMHEQAGNTLQIALKEIQDKAPWHFSNHATSSIAFTLATEPVQQGPNHPMVHRMKKSFTSDEQGLARQLVESTHKQ